MLALLNTAWSNTITHAVGAVGWVARARCGLSGHDMLRHFEPHRLSLECLQCGKTSAGWAFDGD